MRKSFSLVSSVPVVPVYCTVYVLHVCMVFLFLTKCDKLSVDTLFFDNYFNRFNKYIISVFVYSLLVKYLFNKYPKDPVV